ncbi:hypothetical protein B0H13DRAFT_878918 [Mycena leptocephala]|nr:hypothetical protein B0H13DRAFT_309391 [Mycena leptocephala]KAJ7890302.1 hypothetical protein B0H13DRAFT_878918 [Mycena leptocephala]
MENDDHSANDEFTSNSAGDHPEFSTAGSHDGGSIFSGSHHFTVAGGTFNNITKNYSSAPTVPSDFRMIPLGDIDIQHEIRLNKFEGSSVVGRRGERAYVRRVYSARIDGKNAPTTVAMYQGPGAEEEWQQDIAKYMSVRHPNIVQMFGAASSGGVHATFFHGDLIPYHHFVGLHRHSPVLTVFIQGFCIAEFSGLQEYFSSAFQTDLKLYILDASLHWSALRGSCARELESRPESTFGQCSCTRQLEPLSKSTFGQRSCTRQLEPRPESTFGQ